MFIVIKHLDLKVEPGCREREYLGKIDVGYGIFECKEGSDLKQDYEDDEKYDFDKIFQEIYVL